MKRWLVGITCTAGLLVVGASPALGQESPNNDVQGVTQTNTPVAPVVEAQTVAQAPARSAQTLPVTGGDVVGMAAVGAAAVAAGGGLLVLRRRRAQA